MKKGKYPENKLLFPIDHVVTKSVYLAKREAPKQWSVRIRN